MNQISLAMKEAGVRLPPLNRRIWLWLHDHPGKTSKDIGLALGIPWSTASSVLSDMEKRKMVKAGRDNSVNRYETLGKNFELLPRPKKKVAELAIKPPVSEVLETPTIKPVDTSKPLLGNLENYTIKELRVVRDKLNKLFEDLS